MSRNGRLFLISFLILFLEISLIRWVSTEIRIFAYVHNLVLLACFLGIGVGLYRAGEQARLRVTILALSALLFLVTVPLKFRMAGTVVHPLRDIPTMLSVFPDSLIWYEAVSERVLLLGSVGIGMTLLIFATILVLFVPLGQVLGAAFDRHPSLIFAYSLNILASLLGVWFFNLLSMRWAPPWIWYLVSLLGMAALMRRSGVNASLLATGCAVLALMALWPRPDSGQIVWSPYQKLEAVPLADDREHGEYRIKVNGMGYMLLLDLSDHHLLRHPGVFDVRARRFSQYDVPYFFVDRPGDVLIVGAGGGNDVAGALRNGAQAATAVEIDPGIYRLGSKFHPERPYADPRVEIVIDDARSYFRRTERSFDLVSFGLLDSHTLSSSYNNIRLDHFVYTREAFEEARRLLKDGGVLTVIFECQRPWMAGRIAGLLEDVFGEEPLAFRVRSDEKYGYGGDMFVVSADMRALRAAVATRPELRLFLEKNRLETGAPPRLTTDDWPYFYLEGRLIPRLHLALSAVLVVLFVSLRSFVIPRGKRIHPHFFFLGAAFLLLEFLNISKMQLLLGSTWVVNSFAISAILAMILLGNLVAARWRSLNLGLAYGGLFASILVLLLVPLNALHPLEYAARGILGGLLLGLPVPFAAIVFIDSFQRAEDRTVALGSNILGAAVGGILESLSFVTGVHLLLVLVGLLYLGSLWGLGRRAPTRP